MLFVFKLLIANLNVILLGFEERLNETEELVCDFMIIERLVEVDHGLADLDGDLTSLGERKMTHEVGVFVHREDGETHCVKWHC